MTICRAVGAAVLLAGLLAQAAPAAERGADGALLGWVEDSQGAPVSGAVISVFGQGLRGGLVTLSDSTGRFFLPSLPAGSYTLRALGEGLAARARQVTVLPDTDAVFTLSLAPVGELLADAEEKAVEDERAAARRERRWLVRHKRRSVLEGRGQSVPLERAQLVPPGVDAESWLSRLSGTLAVMANPAAVGGASDSTVADDLPTSFGLLRLQGSFGESGEWFLGGLLSETDNAAWRMAAEFAVDPMDGHELRAGIGYGRGLLRAETDGQPNHRSTGVMFVQDRFQFGERVTATIGTRYSFIGFLENRNHLDPMASLEVGNSEHGTLRGSFSRRTVSPGGDLLTLSTLGSTPAIAFALMRSDLRPEELTRYELAYDRRIGATSLGAHAFYEGVHDQLVNAFEGSGATRSLRITNGPGMVARGMGVSMSRRFGGVATGSVTYTFGRGSCRCAPGEAVLGDGNFHDVVGRLETFIDWSDTRLVAFYRYNTLAPEGESRARFDVRLTQGVPFLGSITHADWEVLVAFRNLFYEASEGGTLDEIAVVNPPRRVLGGISVRF